MSGEKGFEWTVALILFGVLFLGVSDTQLVAPLLPLIAGDFAPPTIGATMGFTLVEVEEGFAAFEGQPSARVLNPMGIVHGGWALTLIDSCCGCAGHTTLPAGVGYGTVETKVNFVRPIGADTGVLRAEGRVLALGRTLITAEGKLFDKKSGKLLWRWPYAKPQGVFMWGFGSTPARAGDLMLLSGLDGTLYAFPLS